MKFNSIDIDMHWKIDRQSYVKLIKMLSREAPLHGWCTLKNRPRRSGLIVVMISKIKFIIWREKELERGLILYIWNDRVELKLHCSDSKKTVSKIISLCQLGSLASISYIPCVGRCLWQSKKPFLVREQTVHVSFLLCRMCALHEAQFTAVDHFSVNEPTTRMNLRNISHNYEYLP